MLFYQSFWHLFTQNVQCLPVCASVYLRMRARCIHAKIDQINGARLHQARLKRYTIRKTFKSQSSMIIEPFASDVFPSARLAYLNRA
jgi:hypothetical protein